MIDTILVTGGAGYIGSHMCVALLQAGFTVVVVDNLNNSSVVAIDRIERITGKKPAFYQINCQDKVALTTVFAAHPIDAVIHMAGYKAVGESCEKPLMYYQNNLDSTLVLLDVMREFSVDKLVFSSSATVYGDPAIMPVTEDFPTFATNPYGRTKLMIEEILRDVVNAEPDKFKVALLRYFNPGGSDASGLIGEDPKSIPNNLLPFVTQVAVGKRAKLSVFGGDYATVDGTGVRDYIHVMDLAAGHIAALRWLDSEAVSSCCQPINLGTGRGYSVLEVVKTFENVSGQQVPYEIVARRPGDVATSYADSGLAKTLLNWQAEKTLEDMLRDAWNWQQKNPNGFSDD